MLFLLVYLAIILFSHLLSHNTFKRGNTCAAQRKTVTDHTSETASPSRRFKSKPAWVKHEVIRLAALMPDQGCRKMADVFNRLFLINRQMSVSKSYVANVIRDHRYAIQVLRRQLKHQPPKVIAKQVI